MNISALKRVSAILAVLCLSGLGIAILSRSSSSQDRFLHLMTTGNGYLEAGDATNATAAYLQAARLFPDDLDVHLNLANASLLAGDPAETVRQCQEAIHLDPDEPASYYLLGCAYVHLNQLEPAVQAFQQSQKIDPAVSALNFQLGLAQARLGHLDDAIREFQTLLRFEPGHPSAHYQLSRLYQQAGRNAEAAQEMEWHQKVLAKTPAPSNDPRAYEKCKYTSPRIVFVPEQPDPRGIPVRFVEATADAFVQATNYHAPMAILDYSHDGRCSLFVTEGNSFRVLDNRNGHFKPLGDPLPGIPGANYRRCLVGDLNNDRVDDVIVLGEQASHAFRFATNGQAHDVTTFAGLKTLRARDGLLADLDFTGKLDLLAVLPDGRGLQVFQNLGNFYFKDATVDSGLPATGNGIGQVAVEDWNNDDLPGVFIAREGQSPAYFAKQRAGAFTETNLNSTWPAGNLMATGDLNNDLHPDLVIVGEQSINVFYSGTGARFSLPLEGFHPRRISLVDYDNDGWLDLIACGDNGVRVWRNLGQAGFREVSSELGLDKTGPVDDMVAADYDNDGDTDLILSSPTGLHFWRNDGGNANRQLKLRLVGNRSNASAIGVRVELTSDHWHSLRTLQQAPLEVGLGQHNKLDVLKVRWFDLATTFLDVQASTRPVTVEELTLPTGSCPYLYAWNGKQFRFVTDVLGASPLGLPGRKSHYIEPDPDEYLALGNEQAFPAKNGAFEIRLTEELREVLYLDAAQLVAVDHPPGTIIVPTSKLRPRKPFPSPELWTLRPMAPLQAASRSDGMDVTKALRDTDNEMVSPVQLREPQLRGLAEPWSVTMDFGELPANRQLVLVLTGWLRFGGGMANVAASLDENLPFPFPTLEAELPDGSWKPVATDVGAPCGKTKTMLVDLENKLPAGAHRLRLTTAFEIYWDSARLCEKVSAVESKLTRITPDHTDLHWRGFSRFAPLSPDLPLTPEYYEVQNVPPWRRNVSGWCTRYGAVDELVQAEDSKLVLLNGGDELALSFAANQLPPKPGHCARDFFLFVTGWDKDADFHVGQGWRVEPLPFRGMDDQAYDRLSPVSGSNADWIARYNTRWVGPLVLKVGSR